MDKSIQPNHQNDEVFFRAVADDQLVLSYKPLRLGIKIDEHDLIIENVLMVIVL